MRLLFLPIALATLTLSPFVVADDVEVIEVRAERNRLLTNELIDDNTSAVVLADASMVKATMADWMAIEPSVSLNGQGGLFQSYSLRGFSRARIRTEVDGVPIITDRRAGNSASFISPYLISRIDIQKGPSSTLYGSEAMGGVINLVSNQPTSNQFTYNIQSNDQLQEIGALLGGNHWQSGFSYRHANNGKSANGDELNTGFEQFSALVKYQAEVSGYNINASWLPSVGKDIGKGSALYPTARVVNYPEEIHSVSQISIEQSNQWYFKLYHHYQNWDTNTLRVGKRRNVTEYQSQTIGALALVTTHWLGGQGRLGVDWLSRQSVDINDTELTLIGDVSYAKKVVDGEQTNIALFSDLHWQMNDTLLALGVRYDVIEQQQFVEQDNTSDQQFNASASISHSISDTQTLSAEWATGFRFPTLSELYFEGQTPRGATLGNPNLKPEKSNGVQLRWRGQYDAWQIHAEAYYYQLDDYIERYTLENDVRSYRNIGQAYIVGGELSVNWQVNENVFMRWTSQYQQGEDAANHSLADLLPAQLAWQTTWYFGDLKLINQLNWQFEQSEVGPGEQKRTDHLLWQINVTKPLNDQLSVSLYGNNLTNENVYKTADEDAPIIQGRTIGFKINWAF